MICDCLSLHRFVFLASRSTISLAGLVFLTRLETRAGFRLWGTIIACFMMLYSFLSISVPFHSSAATMGVPKYMRSDLPKQLTRVSITMESAYLSFHLRNPIFLLICWSTSFLCLCLFVTSLSPRYLTLSLTSIPSIYLILLSPSLILRISHFFRLIFRLKFVSICLNPLTTRLISLSFLVNIVISSAYARRSFRAISS